MTRELRDKERELLRKSIELRSINTMTTTFEIGQNIQKKQDEIYKKRNFYKGLINAIAERKQK